MKLKFILAAFSFSALAAFLSASGADVSPALPLSPSASGFVPQQVTASVPGIFNVRDYGAKGDRQTKDTEAFQKALDACALYGVTHSNGEVRVPKGNYLLGSVVLGPNTTIRLEPDAYITESPDLADYPIIKARFEGEMTDCHRSLFYASHADHIAILGPGGIYATSSLCFPSNRNPRAPCVFEPVDCFDVLVENFSLQYDEPASGQHADMWCIHPNFCNKFTARNLTIRSQLANGDGLDIDSCSDVVIEGCDISTGDDAIALKSGRGMEAARMGRPTTDVTIRDCKLHSVIFAALAIGSEISGGIRNVDIHDCTLSGVQNAIFIKSRQGRGAFIENFTGEDLVIESSPTFIGINLVSTGNPATEPVPGPLYDWTYVRNLNFENVQVKNVQTLIGSSGGKDTPSEISPDAPINGFTLTNITGTCQRGITLDNVVNAHFSRILVKGFTGNLLNLTNVTGTGLDNPAANAAPASTTPVR